MKRQWMSGILAGCFALSAFGGTVARAVEPLPYLTQTLSTTSPEEWFEVDLYGAVKYRVGFAEDGVVDFAIPSVVEGGSVSAIQDYGFRGLEGIQSVSVPDSVSTIGSQAFANCEDLMFVSIPASVVHIGDDLLKGSDSATVYAYTGSYAVEYCKEKGIPYVAMIASVPEVSEPEVAVPEETFTEVEVPSWGKLAVASAAKVQINGKDVSFDAYNIDGFNYFRLTDLAYALTGTTSQCNVVWDAEKAAINVMKGYPYTVKGDEFEVGSGQNKVAEPFYSTTYVDGEVADYTVYIIDGKSYFQLNSLKDSLGLTLGWNSSTSTISITTPEREMELADAYRAAILSKIKYKTITYLVLDLKDSGMTDQERANLVNRLDIEVGDECKVLEATIGELGGDAVGLLLLDMSFGVPIQYTVDGLHHYTFTYQQQTSDGYIFDFEQFWSTIKMDTSEVTAVYDSSTKEFSVTFDHNG